MQRPGPSIKELKARLKAQHDGEQASADVPDTDKTKEAEERKARQARMNARFAPTKGDQEKTSKALQQDAALFGSASHHSRFQANRAAIVKWTEQMHEQTKLALMKRLNIQHLMVEANEGKLENVEAVMPQHSQATPMQVLPVAGMYHRSRAQSIEVADPAQTSTFTEVFSFTRLCQLAIAEVPNGKEVTNELVTEKLEAFTQIARQFDADALLKFEEDQKRYDDLLVRLRAASPIDEPRLRGEFLSLQKTFVQLNNQLLPQMLEAVTHLSDLIAYLENNPGVGIDVRKTLQSEYDKQGHSEIVQMKKSLIESCSPTVCAALEIKVDESANVLSTIESILLDQALQSGNEAVANKFIK